MKVAYNKLTYEEVKMYVEENSNCKLISTEYEKAIAKMKFICNCGNIFETTFSKFKSRNKRQCNQCSGREKISEKKINEILNKRGLSLFEGEPLNIKDKAIYINKGGYKVYMSIGQLQRGHDLKFFHTFNPFTIDNIKCYIKEKNANCKLLSDEYKGYSPEKLLFQCKCGELYETTFGDFKARDQFHCYSCGKKKRSGENHYEYNPLLTYEDRVRRRRVTPNENMRVFRTKVYERDNYICKCCGDKSSKGNPITLNAHHLDGYHWFKEGRFNPNNGVTLCSYCHNKFHEIYGKKNNTKEQFEEYKNKQFQHV